jgi:hypothetical protein
MEKKYIPYKFSTSLSGWREHWFYIGNHQPTLPEMTTEGPKIAGEWRLGARDMSQVNELLSKIKEHRDAGVTRASVVYTWIGRRIQPLQQ